MDNYTTVENPKKLDGLRVINDLDDMVETLRKGETIAHFEWGNSMSPIFPNGGYCRLTPLKSSKDIQSGDAVFCNVRGYWMTHMVWIVNRASGWCLIGSTHGEFYGWTNEILAIATPMKYIEKETEREEDED